MHEFTIFRMYKSFANSVMQVRICVRKIYAQKLAYKLSWIACLVWRANIRYHAKWCVDRSNRCWAIVIFKLLECRQPPSWISLDLKFVTDQTVTRAKLRHRTKFRWNRWNCGRDMAIFQNGGGHHVGFLKLQSSNCGTHHKCRIASPCQIGQTFVEISRFWIFQDVGSHNLRFLHI